MPFKANDNREAVVVCARHVVKRPSKRSVLVYSIGGRIKELMDIKVDQINQFWCIYFIRRYVVIHL